MISHISSLLLVYHPHLNFLTDGLDGLAIMPIVLVSGALGVFAYLSGNINFSEYLLIPYVKDSGEITIFIGALIGSGLGFLWFNTYPAQVFMGDVGALSLGAAVGLMAVIVRQENTGGLSEKYNVLRVYNNWFYLTNRL